MQAIVLAAGMGKRLQELTRNNTKCMVKVNGVTLIERLMRQLDQRHLSRIVVVIGYEGRKLEAYIDTLGIRTPVTYVKNPIYDRTNNIYSLALAKDFLRQDDTLLFESDIIFEDSILDELLNDPRNTLALVDKYENWMDGTCMKLDEVDRIVAFISNRNFKYSESADYFKTVNIYKFGRDFSESCYIPFLEAYCKALGDNEYYEQVLKVITVLDETKIYAKRLQGQKWYEIDDIQDLDIAESIFAPDEEQQLFLMQRRYGGYWRYPKLVDFCYLVNPYFPAGELMEEMKANFERLLTQYPSGMSVNSLLAAKNFGIARENVLVGNGAAELIRMLMQTLSGNTGFIRPTFEEYPNRYPREKSVFLSAIGKNFSYSAEDIMGYFENKKITNLVLINPDNPSGNYIKKQDVSRIIAWTKEKGIRFILDESFVDFAEEEDSTMIRQEILDKNLHLCVVKSISKCYGVPGLRLGILASGDRELIQGLKNDAAIWNINSLAEFYMQMAGKYQREYIKSLEKVKTERKRLFDMINRIEGIRPIPSQANYIMAELTGGLSSSALTRRLLVKHNLFIKDLSGKISDGQYIRLAVRGREDNDRLSAALNEELCGSGY